MKKMKLLSAVIAAAMAVSLFAGCSQKKEQVEIKSGDDLWKLSIGVQSGTTGDTYTTRHFTKAGIEEFNRLAEESGEEKLEVPADTSNDATIARYNKATDAAQDLKNGRIDCVVVDKMPAQKIVDKNSDLQILDFDLTEEEYAIAVGKDNQELTDSINATLEKLMNDGTYDKMIAYFIDGDTSVELPEVPAGEGEIVMGTNAEFEPFEYHGENNEIVGFDIYLSQWIASDLGKNLKVEDMAFDSLIGALESGKVDFVAAGMTEDPERAKSVNFSNSYYNASQVIIVRK